jgi:hypothetical protein
MFRDRRISRKARPAPALNPKLVAAYRSASQPGKAFAERLITEIDPSYLAISASYPLDTRRDKLKATVATLEKQFASLQERADKVPA